MAKHVALYGKGGTGKTTIAANLAAALAEGCRRVLLVGCSPTADSSRLLLGETDPQLLLHSLAGTARSAVAPVITGGYRGVGCIEIGDAPAADCCTSRNIAATLKQLDRERIIAAFAPDFVVYDLPGDVGCIGTAVPEDFAIDLSLVVTSADFQALYAANRLIGALLRLAHPGSMALVVNGSISSFEDSFVADFAGQVGLKVAAAIPRSLAVRHSELYGKTVIEAGPLSSQAYIYRKLARRLIEDSAAAAAKQRVKPLEAARLKEWANEWGKRLGELEFGIIQDGAGI